MSISVVDLDILEAERLFFKVSKLFNTLIFQPDKDAMIQLEFGNTHIINHGDDDLRVKIRNALVSCLLLI